MKIVVPDYTSGNQDNSPVLDSDRVRFVMDNGDFIEFSVANERTIHVRAIANDVRQRFGFLPESGNTVSIWLEEKYNS